MLFTGTILAVGLFALSESQDVPFLDRKRRTLFSPQTEVWIGDMISKAFLYSSIADVVDPTDPVVHHIQEIGDHITALNGLPPHRYFLIHSAEKNAFVLPGRTVFIYTGILPVFANQSGAAMVIAHEIGHVLAGHSFENLFYLLPMSILASYLLGSAGNSLLTYLVNLPRSRKAELEADAIGYHMMAASCFDIKEAPKVFNRLCEATGGDHADEFATHPSWEKRLYQLGQLQKSSSVQNLACNCGQPRFNPARYHYLSHLNIYTHKFPKITEEQLKKAFE